MVVLLAAYLLLSCFDTFTEANFTQSPRMVFTDKENIFKRLQTHRKPAEIFLGEQPGVVTAVGPAHLDAYRFQSPEQPHAEWKLRWPECGGDADCSYNVTVAKQRDNSSLVLVCGSNSRETRCCDLDIAQPSAPCSPSEKLEGIANSIVGFIHEAGGRSILVESEDSADLYMTCSGSQDRVGIFKFGSRRVMPASHDEEQYYAGLLPIRRKDDPSQDVLYAFYKQRNRDAGLDSEMWHSFVTRVCMADVGGPKNHLQFTWTSQMNARLFCGDPETRRHFPELVETAFVGADRWEDTRIYALFRNEWGMSAVCVYAVGDIHGVFSRSAFQGGSSENRPRTCVPDSTKLPSDILRTIDRTSDMEDWVLPVNGAGPLLVSRHNYTDIDADSSWKNSRRVVLFLSLHNGGIHKVLSDHNQTFVIAEYRPFNHSAHILSISLHPSSRKLYVTTLHELVQVDVANCGRYGNTCGDCVLARDPHCGWKDGRCTSDTQGALQDVAAGDPAVCPASTSKSRLPGKAPPTGVNVARVELPYDARYFLSCPVSSRHARYTWRNPDGAAACRPGEERCLFLIHRMGPRQAGAYRCVSEEKGHSKVLAHYQLDLQSRAAGQQPALVVWVCSLVTLIKSLYC